MSANTSKAYTKSDYLILAIMAVGVIGVIFYNIYAPVISNPSETIGEVIGKDRISKSRVSVYQYSVDGTVYQVNGWDRAYNGDLYVVEYDPKDPSSARVLAHKPALPPGDSTSTIMATIIESHFINRMVTYQFEVGEYYFERLQKLPPDESIRDPKYALGNRIQIEYSVENPNHSKIRY